MRHVSSPSQPQYRLRATLDRTGVLASVGCAIHCMAAPLLVLFAPTLGGLWVHPATHMLIGAFVLPIALCALVRGYGIHQKRWIVTVGGIGMLGVLVGVFLPWLVSPTGTTTRDCCPTLAQDAATGDLSLQVPLASVVTMLGGAALVVAHLANIRCACRRCGTEEPQISRAG